LSSLSQGTKRHPGLTDVSLVGLPRLEMIARSHEIESGAFRRGSQAYQFRHGKLLMGKHE
jgi:hypothetical protein